MLATEDRLAIHDLLALYGHVGGGLPRRPEDVGRRPGRCSGDRLRSSLHELRHSARVTRRRTPGAGPVDIDNNQVNNVAES